MLLKQFVLSMLIMAAAGGMASAQENIRIDHPRAAAVADATKPGAVFMTIVNIGAEDDRLTAIETPAAGMAQIHSTKMSKKKMRMRRKAGLPLKAGESLELKHGDLHVMLMQLAGPLAAGTTVPITLVFEKAGAVALDVPVMDMAAHAD